MTLQQLQYLVALVEKQHFVKAAESCFVTQPTLTMQIQKLEDEVGIQLIDRKKKPLEPTLLGFNFVKQARKILKEVEDLKQIVQKETDQIDGEFRLGIIPTVAPYLLPLFLPKFISRYPKTKLIIREVQSKYLIEQIQNGTCDFGLLATPTEASEIHETPLYKESFQVYHHEEDMAFRKGDLKIGTLDPSRLLLLEEGHCFREQSLRICGERENRDLEFVYQSGSIEGLKNLVDQNLGYTLIPFLASNSCRKEQLSNFKSTIPSREISLIRHVNSSKIKLQHELQGLIIECLPPEVRSITRSKRITWT
jgi:LysR family hydrogen peroxide-inducible transcriptional activator